MRSVFYCYMHISFSQAASVNKVDLQVLKARQQWANQDAPKATDIISKSQSNFW